MKRLLLQGILVFAALFAAGCSSSKAPQAASPQQAAVPPAVTSSPASASLPAAKPEASSTAFPPLTSLSKGMLIVDTIPGRAKVYLDNEYQGLTPLKVESDPGVHAISIKLEGYRMVAEKVTVRSGEHTEMDLTLER